VIGHLKKVGKGGWKIETDKLLSYSRARQILMDGMKPIKEKFPDLNFGTHSASIRGATKASNMGIHDRLLDNHGRWKDSGSKNLYIRDSKSKKLSVTKSLGI